MWDLNKSRNGHVFRLTVLPPPQQYNDVKCSVFRKSNHILLALQFDFEQFLLGNNVEKKDKTKIKCTHYSCCFPSPLQPIINFLLDLSLKTLEIKTVLNKRLFLRYNCCCNLLCLTCFILCVLHIPQMYFWRVDTDAADIKLFRFRLELISKSNKLYDMLQ